MKKREKIPRVIHYCWFGHNEKPKEVIDCINSWKKYCPDYKIVEWNESNYDVNKCKFISEAYKAKKWAFVTDYARLDIIYNNGGIYLDTDVELIKNLDNLLDYDCYLGTENGNYINTGLGFGAQRKNSFIKLNKEFYENMNPIDSNETMELINCPIITTKLLKEKGAKLNNKIEKIDNVTIFPIEYFCPMNYLNGKIKITKNTYSIHRYTLSWGSDYEKKRTATRRKLSKIFGVTVSEFLCKIIFLFDNRK